MSELKATVAAPADTSRLLIDFVRDYLHRGYRVRDAVGAGFRAVANHYGPDSEVAVSEEAFEKTVAYFEGAVEAYRAAQEAGHSAVTHGLYAEVVSDDEFRSRVSSGGKKEER